MHYLNNSIEKISEYPFSRLRNLLLEVECHTKEKALDLSIGQPYHSFPSFVKTTLLKENSKWGLYPPISGIPSLRSSYIKWLKKRFELKKLFFDSDNVMPLSGTREGLFSLSLVLLVKQIIVPNPFYQVYLGASLFQNLPIVLMNTTAKENYLPELDKIEFSLKKNPSLIYFCNPSNPQGKCASEEYLKKLVFIVRKYNSILALDECYTDIYTDKKPVGGIEVCEKSRKGLKNVLIFHSLSKRSNVAGLRSGFVVGDKKIIDLFKKLRSYSAPTIPLPIQILSAKLWADEKHVKESRALYKKKFDYADKKLSEHSFYKRPDAGFYLWLKVGNGVDFTKSLYQKHALKVMPGKFLAIGKTDNPGNSFVRISLVHNFVKCKKAIDKISKQIQHK